MIKLNLTNIKPYVITAGIAGVIFLIILTLLITNGLRKPRPVIYKPSPIPSLNPQKLPQAESFQTELSKIEGILPYTGPNFTIRYRLSINIISAEIKAKDRDEFVKIRKEAEDFIKSKGVSDMCSLNIFWETPEGSTLYKDLQATDFLTTGCQPSIKK